MSNAWDDMYAAVNQAKDVMSSADRFAQQMATILRGRLRHVSSSVVLADLKRELRDFDMTTGKWKP